MTYTKIWNEEKHPPVLLMKGADVAVIMSVCSSSLVLEYFVVEVVTAMQKYNKNI